MLTIPAFILAIQDEGDRGFMEALYRQFYRLLYRRAYAVLRSKPDAEDVVSDAFLAMIPRVDALRAMEEDTQRAYALSTVKNLALNHLNKPRRRKLYDVDDGFLDSVPAPAPSAEERVIREEEVDALHARVAQLPEKWRDLLRMKYYLEYSDAEIAREMGLALSSVRTYLARLRAHLFTAMKDEENGDE